MGLWNCGGIKMGLRRSSLLPVLSLPVGACCVVHHVASRLGMEMGMEMSNDGGCVLLVSNPGPIRGDGLA